MPTQATAIGDLTASVAPSGSQIWVPALLIAIGVIGVLVPVLPGLLVSLIGVLVWAVDADRPLGWVIFGLCCAWYAVGLVVKYVLPGRRMREQGIGSSTLLLAVLVGIVGFFVIPVIGAPVGFVLAIYLVERARSRDGATAWARTKHAIVAVLHSIGLELLTGLVIATTWAIGAVVIWRQTH